MYYIKSSVWLFVLQAIFPVQSLDYSNLPLLARLTRDAGQRVGKVLGGCFTEITNTAVQGLSWVNKHTVITRGCDCASICQKSNVAGQPPLCQSAVYRSDQHTCEIYATKATENVVASPGSAYYEASECGNSNVAPVINTGGGSNTGGTVPGGIPGGSVPGGIPGGSVPGGIPGGSVPGGIPGGSVPGGIPGGSVPGGIPGGSVPGGIPGGSVPGGNTGGTVPGGNTGGTNTSAAGTTAKCAGENSTISYMQYNNYEVDTTSSGDDLSSSSVFGVKDVAACQEQCSSNKDGSGAFSCSSITYIPSDTTCAMYNGKLKPTGPASLSAQPNYSTSEKLCVNPKLCSKSKPVHKMMRGVQLKDSSKAIFEGPKSTIEECIQTCIATKNNKCLSGLFVAEESDAASSTCTLRGTKSSTSTPLVNSTGLNYYYFENGCIS